MFKIKNQISIFAIISTIIASTLSRAIYDHFNYVTNTCTKIFYLLGVNISISIVILLVFIIFASLKKAFENRRFRYDSRVIDNNCEKAVENIASCLSYIENKNIIYPYYVDKLISLYHYLSCNIRLIEKYNNTVNCNYMCISYENYIGRSKIETYNMIEIDVKKYLKKIKTSMTDEQKEKLEYIISEINIMDEKSKA